MKQRKAILYVRVSTDEQADKGHSLAHQEDKLRHYCLYNNIEVVAFYKEDHSAKTFERPQFKAMLEFLKRNKNVANTLLFLKWDRFSRNAPEAYGMISTLAKLGIEPQAAEQPLNLEVPEQKIMLALYLTAPEVENDRRAMNVFAGMRRAKKEGRYIGSAPYGYKHSRNEYNKPCIVPGNDADLVREAFRLMATGDYHIEELRKMLYAKGLKATRNTFWALLRNPVYIGKVHIPAYKDEPEMIVDGTHEGLISEDLFYEAQDALEGRKRKNMPSKHSNHEELQLRGFLRCTKCGKNLTGSASKGHGGKYYYYHCKGGCKERHRADLVNEQFDALLERISGNKKTLMSFELILSDSFKKGGASKAAELEKLKKELATCQERLDKAQTLLLDGAISPADYSTMRGKLEPQISRLARQIGQSDNGESREIEELMSFGFYFLHNLAKLFRDAGLEQKRRIIGSTFPEKLVFENGECRTSNEEDILSLLSRTGTGSRGREKGKASVSADLSCRVASTGIEPVSKV